MPLFIVKPEAYSTWYTELGLAELPDSFSWDECHNCSESHGDRIVSLAQLVLDLVNWQDDFHLGPELIGVEAFCDAVCQLPKILFARFFAALESIQQSSEESGDIEQ